MKVIDPEFWKSRRVLVTGHTGFKGSWLALWLERMGAQVAGISLANDDPLSIYKLAGVSCLVEEVIGDIVDSDVVSRCCLQFKPDIVFHLAAQPLVRASYDDPVETFRTNILGTVRLLESLRHCQSVRAVINVTSDKCYQNDERTLGYIETDKLGGHDAYSASKACSELVSSAYRSSFFKTRGVGLATARSGNVLGGGDWSKDRLAPDIFRASLNGERVVVRSPDSIRPWQHVLEALAGYLALAERLYDDEEAFSGPWNFGPPADEGHSVREVALILANELRVAVHWGASTSSKKKEANVLFLDSSKAHESLGWRPTWTLGYALEKTLSWNKSALKNEDMLEISCAQIEEYVDCMHDKKCSSK